MREIRAKIEATAPARAGRPALALAGTPTAVGRSFTRPSPPETRSAPHHTFCTSFRNHVLDTNCSRVPVRRRPSPNPPFLSRLFRMPWERPCSARTTRPGPSSPFSRPGTSPRICSPPPSARLDSGLPLSATQAGAVGSALLLSSAAAGFLLASRVDRVGPRTLARIGLLLAVLGYGGAALTQRRPGRRGGRAGRRLRIRYGDDGGRHRDRRPAGPAPGHHARPARRLRARGRRVSDRPPPGPGARTARSPRSPSPRSPYGP